jgi:PAS domain S-box-containing protein
MNDPDEEIYKLLIESVKDYAIFMLDTEGRVKTWNQGAERIKGYKAEEIIDKHFSTFYTAEHRMINFPQQALEVASKEGRFEHEGWRVCKDGSLFWANVVITAMRDKEGQLVGFSKVTRNLTERKHLEDELQRSNLALRESEANYRLLIEGVKDYAIFMLDTEGRVKTWNQGAERIKGYKAGEIIDKHFSTFYTLDSVKSGFPSYELLKAKEEGRFEDEGWRVRKDGSLFWANVVITAIYDTNQLHLGFSKITRDLTERVRNEQIMQKNQELLRINTDLDNFIYMASHDLKSPIANLEGVFQILLRKLQGKLTNPEQELLGLIHTSITKLKQTIGSLTEVAKTQRSGQESLEEVSIREVWEEVKEELAQALAHALGSIQETIQVERYKMNRAHLRSIFYNLLSNAIKYHKAGRPLEVEFICYQQGQALVISVKDNGLGFSAAQQSKLFTMFKRFHNHVEGTGVGLYMVKRIVENRSGRIEAKSELDKGSEFNIYLPLN